MDFVGKRKVWFLLALSLIVVGLISLAFRGLNMGIDFQGGSLVEYSFEERVELEEINGILANMDLKSGTTIQQMQQDQGSGILIRSTAWDAGQREEVLKAIKQRFPSVTQLRAESVWPTIGKELLWKAILSLVVAFVAIVIYISFRFEFKLALAAIVALLHDVLIVVGFFSVTGLEVGIPFVAGLLTIVGYSINDTIVIFDRIRENKKYNRYKDKKDLINASIKETLPRTLSTSVTTLFSVLAILLFGGVTLRVFMVTMFIGFVAGTFSSVFIASPLVVSLDKIPGR